MSLSSPSSNSSAMLTEEQEKQQHLALTSPSSTLTSPTRSQHGSPTRAHQHKLASNYNTNLSSSPLRLISKSQRQEKTPACQLCERMFTRTIHFCRYCGQCVCSSCSSWTINNYRACKTCAKKTHTARCGHCICVLCNPMTSNHSNQFCSKCETTFPLSILTLIWRYLIGSYGRVTNSQMLDLIRVFNVKGDQKSSQPHSVNYSITSPSRSLKSSKYTFLSSKSSSPVHEYIKHNKTNHNSKQSSNVVPLHHMPLREGLLLCYIVDTLQTPTQLCPDPALTHSFQSLFLTKTLSSSASFQNGSLALWLLTSFRHNQLQDYSIKNTLILDSDRPKLAQPKFGSTTPMNASGFKQASEIVLAWERFWSTNHKEFNEYRILLTTETNQLIQANSKASQIASKSARQKSLYLTTLQDPGVDLEMTSDQIVSTAGLVWAKVLEEFGRATELERLFWLSHGTKVSESLKQISFYLDKVWANHQGYAKFVTTKFNKIQTLLVDECTRRRVVERELEELRIVERKDEVACKEDLSVVLTELNSLKTKLPKLSQELDQERITSSNLKAELNKIMSIHDTLATEHISLQQTHLNTCEHNSTLEQKHFSLVSEHNQVLVKLARLQEQHETLRKEKEAEKTSLLEHMTSLEAGGSQALTKLSHELSKSEEDKGEVLHELSELRLELKRIQAQTVTDMSEHEASRANWEHETSQLRSTQDDLMNEVSSLKQQVLQSELALASAEETSKTCYTELQAECRAREQELIELGNTHAELNKLLDEERAEHLVMKARQASSALQYEQEQTQVVGLQVALASSKQELTDVKRESGFELKKANTMWQIKHEHLAEQLQQAQAAHTVLETKLIHVKAEATQSLEQSSLSLQATTASLLSSEQAYLRLEQDLKTSRDELTALKKLRAMEGQQVTKLTNELTDTLGKLDETKATAEATRSEYVNTKGLLQSMEDMLENTHKQLTELTASARAESEQARDRVENFEEELSKLNKNLATVQTNLEMKENYADRIESELKECSARVKQLEMEQGKERVEMKERLSLQSKEHNEAQVLSRTLLASSESQITDLTTRLDTLSSQHTILTRKHKKAANQLVILRDKVKGCTKVQDQLTQQLERMTAERKALSISHSELLKNQQSVEKDKNKAEQKYFKLFAEKEGLEQEHDSVVERHTNLQKNHKNTLESLKQLKKRNRNGESAVTKELTSLRSLHKEVVNQHETLTKQHEVLTSKHEMLCRSHEQILSEHSQYDQKLNVLEREQHVLNTAHAVLKEQHAIVASELNESNRSLTELKVKHANLEMLPDKNNESSPEVTEKLEELRAECDRLQAQLDDLISEHATLAAQKSELATSLEKQLEFEKGLREAAQQKLEEMKISPVAPVDLSIARDEAELSVQKNDSSAGAQVKEELFSLDSEREKLKVLKARCDDLEREKGALANEYETFRSKITEERVKQNQEVISLRDQLKEHILTERPSNSSSEPVSAISHTNVVKDNILSPTTPLSVSGQSDQNLRIQVGSSQKNTPNQLNKSQNSSHYLIDDDNDAKVTWSPLRSRGHASAYPPRSSAISRRTNHSPGPSNFSPQNSQSARRVPRKTPIPSSTVSPKRGERTRDTRDRSHRLVAEYNEATIHEITIRNINNTSSSPSSSSSSAIRIGRSSHSERRRNPNHVYNAHPEASVSPGKHSRTNSQRRALQMYECTQCKFKFLRDSSKRSDKTCSKCEIGLCIRVDRKTR